MEVSDGCHVGAGFILDAELLTGLRIVLADYKIESPTAIDSRLPNILRFIVFLGMERRMAEIGEKET